MIYPTLVYRTPGAHQCHGGTYDYLQVRDEEELEKAAKAGYYPTLILAIAPPEDFDWAPYVVDSTEQPERPAASVPPPHPAPTGTERAELEKMAAELGIGFNSRTTDETLRTRIDVALSDSEE